MKKRNIFLISIVVLAIVFIVLVITFKTDKTTCTLNSKKDNYSIKSTYTIYSKRNIVTKVVIKEELTSSNNTIKNYYKDKINEQYKENNNNYGGYTYKIDVKGDKLVSNVTINYNVLNLNKLLEDIPDLKNYLDNGRLTVDGLKALYGSMGCKCEE